MNEVLTGSKRATVGLGKALQDMRSVRALVIDANLPARSILRSMLIDLGLQADHIKQVSRYNEARGEIEYHRYDLILCEHHFSETQQTGADLLDEVRAGNHLPRALRCKADIGGDNMAAQRRGGLEQMGWCLT